MTHIRALRAQECLRDAAIVLIGEDNLGNETQEVAEEVLRDVSGASALTRTPGRYGVRTDARTKRAYGFRFADLLAHDSAIKYHDDIVSANPFIANRTPAQRAMAAKVEFERQLHSFKRIFDLAPSLTSTTRVVLTGKADHEKKNTARLKDDMVMAVLIGVYWAGEYVGGRISSRGYADRLLRANAPSIAPVVRHTEFGGQELAAIAGVVEDVPQKPLHERLAEVEPNAKRQRR